MRRVLPNPQRNAIVEQHVSNGDALELPDLREAISAVLNEDHHANDGAANFR